MLENIVTKCWQMATWGSVLIDLFNELKYFQLESYMQLNKADLAI